MRTFNLEDRDRQISEFEARLVYIVSSRPAYRAHNRILYQKSKSNINQIS